MAGNWTAEVSRGQKRRAENEVEGEQRLTKRFDALQLGSAAQVAIDWGVQLRSV